MYNINLVLMGPLKLNKTVSLRNLIRPKSANRPSKQFYEKSEAEFEAIAMNIFDANIPV